MTLVRATILALLLAVLLGLAVAALPPAHAHSIYTGVYGRNGQLCCGGTDCAATHYRERGQEYQFLTREEDWVAIPIDRITFLPIPGDPPSGDSHLAHLCYRTASEAEQATGNPNLFGPIILYCAFIPPGGI